MPHSLILGTAGHIDHGKTTLVKAITGIDTDRLPEEKARGITIDLGFAVLDLGDIRLGIVDVPGHERFIRNMLAGATGIDLALLVVAADDSVMPQTREHLEILTFLGLKKGVVALTKADLVDDTTRDVGILEVRELVKGTFLENAPIIATSATTGLGIAELKEALRIAAGNVTDAANAFPFRLAIDRVFVRQGHGTVVTGSVISGSLKAGDEIEWHHDGEVETVRVRGLAHHGEAVESVHRGQRAAINLAGVPHESVQRGQELAAPRYLKPSRVLSVRLFASVNGRRIKHRLPLRFHIATAEVMGTVSVLNGDAIDPGQSGLAQVFLDEPVTAVWGQPFVVRDSGAETTLGGGQVLQPNAMKIRRRHSDSLVKLEQLSGSDIESRAAAAVWFTGAAGITPTEFTRLAGIPLQDCDAILARLTDSRQVRTIPCQPMVHLHVERFAEIETLILDSLAKLHAAHPLMTNHDRQQTLTTLDYLGGPALLSAIVDDMVKTKKLAGDAKRIARADFKPKLTPNQRTLKDKIVEAHRVAGFTPPEPASFANLAMGNAAALKDIYDVAVAEGLLAKVTTEIYLHFESDMQLKAIIREKMTAAGATVAEIRDWLGTTRKYAVPLCEYLDRIGVTERRGDLRVLKVL